MDGWPSSPSITHSKLLPALLRRRWCPSYLREVPTTASPFCRASGRIDHLYQSTPIGHASVRVKRSNASTRHSRSEEHTSELQSLMRISYAVFCLKKKKNNIS